MLRRSRRQPPATATRTTGPPTSSNGASSLHVWWDPDGAASGGRHPTEIAATLEIIDPPTVPRLHFWALQATFVDRHGHATGTAHLGLQWHPGHPGSTAVNWGGYRPFGAGELGAAEPSALPSATGNPNTRDFAWRPRTPYRLTIHADGRGTVAELRRREPHDRPPTPPTPPPTTLVRRLDVGPDAIGLAHPVVWSEVFARCDDPSTAVRWSDLTPRPVAAHATYQSHADGGCTNTDTSTETDPRHDGPAFVQRTNTERTTPQGRLA